jgi:hypothetical protein
MDTPLLPLRRVALQPPTGKIAVVRKKRMAARLLKASGHVIFRLAALQGGSQELMDLYAAVCGPVRDADAQHNPISHIECREQDGQYAGRSQDSIEVDAHGGWSLKTL